MPQNSFTHTHIKIFCLVPDLTFPSLSWFLNMHAIYAEDWKRNPTEAGTRLIPGKKETIRTQKNNTKKRDWHTNLVTRCKNQGTVRKREDKRYQISLYISITLVWIIKGGKLTFVDGLFLTTLFIFGAVLSQPNEW